MLYFTSFNYQSHPYCRYYEKSTYSPKIGLGNDAGTTLIITEKSIKILLDY